MDSISPLFAFLSSATLRDTAERLFWTFVAAFGSGLLGPALVPSIDLSAFDAALLSGLAAVVNSITLLARRRLDVLPDPGRAVIEATAFETYKQIQAGG